MISWLLVIILSYLFFSFSYFGDKLILSGPPSPRLYTFYVGALGIFTLVFLPFTTFGLPSLTAFWWIILEATSYILGLYLMFIALEEFEVSRVISTIGALQPIFVLILTWIFFSFQTLSTANFLAFVILFLGSIIISIEKKITLTKRYIKLVTLATLMFSLEYVFSKLVFLHQPFLQGMIWMRIVSFLFALIFLLDRSVRAQIFSKKEMLNKKMGFIFLSSQLVGAIATFLQSFSIALSPVAYLPILNALKGIQYVFLFILTLIFSYWYPNILKENLSWKIILQKGISILLIMTGLAILILS